MKKKVQIGIVRESKIPVDWRVPLLPEQCVHLMKLYPHIQFIVQPSDTRCIPNSQYKKAGIPLQEDLSHCDILMGIKEIAEHLLIPQKKYLFFTHTIKKQPQNKKLLQAILEKKIEMIDYECIKDPQGNRLIAFGHFAGIVGAYNSLLHYGRKYNLYQLKPAYKTSGYDEVKKELKKIQLPPVKIVTTGTGRVGKGIQELLDIAGIKKISPHDFLNTDYSYPVYTSLASSDYHVHKEGRAFSTPHFHAYPQEYKSVFFPYATKADILIAGAFWHPLAPKLFTHQDMNHDEFKIKFVGDVTCDFNGSIPCTIKPTTIYDPIYDYNPKSHEVEPPFSDPRNITVMAIENLPGELPVDASEAFGQMLIDNVFPELFGKECSECIYNATIAKDGQLMPAYKYLEDYVSN
ncbi:MAG: NAD(P)-dependent oxidoreductase [Cytophagaceae bacterium]|nr:NAD(P)-dependent oxidoreductase [Cytophagaceae bacterium]MDW8456801.1 NAD(P)-dependent oxidoreductase [Cytophagaceae bacterium]